MKKLWILIALFGIITASCKKTKKEDPKPENPTDTTVTSAWVNAGEPFKTGNPNAHASLAIDKQGTAYLVYQDGSMGNKATVVKLVDSTTWVKVGLPGFSEGQANNPVIAIDENTGLPYVAYLETTTAHTDRVRVMKFNGTSWGLVGNAFFQGGINCSPSLIVDNAGMPHVGYYNFTGQAIATKYDGNNWVEYFAGSLKLKAHDIGLASGGNYVGYLWDTLLSDTRLDVMHSNGGNYTTLNFPGNLSPTSFHITTDKSGTLYIAYENKGPGKQANVSKFYGTWTPVGETNFTTGPARNISLAISPDSASTPYVIYLDASDKANVMRFKEKWEKLGDLQSGTSAYTSIAVDPVSFMPYAAYSGKDGFVTVKKHK